MQTHNLKAKPEKPPTGRPEAHWSFKYIAAVGSLVCLLLLDTGLRLTGFLPPEDPLLFHVKTHMAGFTPFVEDGSGQLTIRPDWLKTDEIYRFTRGTRAGRLFLHPGFRPITFTRKKDPGTLRIFALGGSTTFGQWVGPANAFPQLLEKRLRQARPGRRVEVFNVGCPGLESTRVAILLNTVLAYQPDLIVVYSGHNEMLVGPAITTPAGGPANTVRVWLLRRSSLAAWFNHLLARYLKSRDYEVVSEETAALEAGKIPAYVQGLQDRQVEPLPAAFREKVAATYAANLRAMHRAGRKSGVPVLFVMPAVNLRYPPEQSAHTDSFSSLTRFETLLGHAKKALQNRAFQEALENVDAAIDLSAGYALAHHIRGEILLKSGRGTPAARVFQEAVDLNVYAHRMTSTLQSILADLAAKEGFSWVDLRPDFQSESALRESGALFIDHCHPTRKGHRVITAALLPAVQALLP